MVLFHQKLHIPQVGRQVLPRRGLYQKLEAATISGQAVFLTAPAGWGKTSVLGDWVRTYCQHLPVCWYSLDPGDRDPVIFFRYLLTVLSPHYPPVHHILEQLNFSTPTLEPLIEHLIAALAGTAQSSLLILDNAHVLIEQPLHSAQPILNALDLLIHHTTIRIIFSSHVALPGMVRLLLQGKACLIDCSMLSLSPTDVVELARGRYETEMDLARARRLTKWVGGWPAAIILTLDDWSRRGKQGFHDEALPNMSTRHLYSFLAEQVFLPLPEQIQDFLLETAVLNELVPQHCDALRQTNNSAVLLAEIQRRDLFIDTSGPWIAYHDLFRSFLLARLLEMPDRRRELLRRSAEIYQQLGAHDLAFKRWLESGDLVAAAKLVLAAGPLLRQRGEHSTVMRWLEDLQSQTMLTPALLLLQARNATDTADWGTVNAAIQMAIASAEPTTIIEARLLEASVACIRRDDTRASEIMATIALEALPLELRLKGYEILGRIALNSGRTSAAIDVLTQAISSASEMLMSTDGPTPPAHLYDLLGMAFAMQGDYAASLYYLSQADSIWQALKAPIRRVATLNNLAALAIEEGRLTDARRLLQEGLELAEHYRRHRTQVLLLSGLADVAMLETQFDQALASYTIAYDIAGRTQLAAEQGYACVGALRAAQFAGRQDEQRAWRQALDQLPAVAVTAHAHLVALAHALVDDDLQERLRYLDHAEAAPYMALHDGAQLLLLRVQSAFQQGGWAAAAPHWQKLETRRLPRHLDLLLQVQVGQTPDLLSAVGDSPLARRLRANPREEHVAWTFFALGRFAVSSNGQMSISTVRPIDQLVCIRLLEAGSAGLPVLILWQDVWGDNLYSADALRQSMSRIRRATGLPIQLRQGHCQLLLPWGQVMYDVTNFEALLNLELFTDPNLAIAAIEHRLTLYQGVFLSHLHHQSSWLDKRRTVLHRRALTLREKLAQHIEEHDPQHALNLYTTVLEEEGCREVAAVGAMRCASRLGNRVYAITIYQQVCQSLFDELAAEPSPVLEQIYREIA